MIYLRILHHFYQHLFWLTSCSLAKRCLVKGPFSDKLYVIKKNNRNTRKRCEICSKSKIKTPEKRQWTRSGVSFVKVCLCYIFASLFLSLNESTCQTRLNGFISLQRLFFSSRKSNFKIMHFEISLRHQTSKHKTRNTFHWITWEVNTVC